MNKYSELSDFEINRLVAFRLKIECSFQHNQVVVSDGIFGRAIDYCNNWADAGPLMVEYGIATIVENGKIVGATTDSYEHYEPHGNTVYSVLHANPCRAIAECYLMMTEGEG